MTTSLSRTNYFIAWIFRFILPVIIAAPAMAQWSTSTLAESSLYVCPGFVQSALTYDDGSCVIFGGLSDYEFMQKLDGEGRAVWPEPIEIFHVTGMNALSAGGREDGAGGWFVPRGDHRGAERGEWGFFQNACYIHRVNNRGELLWGAEGVKLADVSGGIKGSYFVSDGMGGCIVQMYESDFLRVGAPKRERTWLMHLNYKGEKLWERPLDTSFALGGAIQPYDLQKIGTHIFLYRKDGWCITDTSGQVFEKTSLVPICTEGDSAFFVFRYLNGGIVDSVGLSRGTYRVARYNQNLDSLWSQEFTISSREGTSISTNNIFLSDRQGGLFYFSPSLIDSARRGVRIYQITKAGVRFLENEIKVIMKSPGFGFAGIGEAGVYTIDGKAQKFDADGNPLWPSDFTVISNPSEAYSQLAYSDHNGGAIVTYWTTQGGIYAKHTGRTGKVGVLTTVHDQTNVARQYELSQNYPNPFNPSTTIRFTLPIAGSATTLKVFDIVGREVAMLVNEKLNAGSYEIRFDGSKLSSGIYIYRLQVGDEVLVRKMTLIK